VDATSGYLFRISDLSFLSILFANFSLILFSILLSRSLLPSYSSLSFSVSRCVYSRIVPWLYV